MCGTNRCDINFGGLLVTIISCLSGRFDISITYKMQNAFLLVNSYYRCYFSYYLRSYRLCILWLGIIWAWLLYSNDLFRDLTGEFKLVNGTIISGTLLSETYLNFGGRSNIYSIAQQYKCCCNVTWQVYCIFITHYKA